MFQMLNLFIKNCSRLIKKNGIMFVATINKNLKSYAVCNIRCRIYFKMVAYRNS